MFWITDRIYRATIIIVNSESRAGHIDQLNAATYELCTPGRFSAWDIRDAIARVTGKEISLTRATGKEVCDFMYGDPVKFAYEYKIVIVIANRHETHDFIGNSDVMGWLLDRPL